MARVTGGIIGDLSGKLGGQVFSRNKAGAYVRSYVSPVNPNTVAQMQARSAFGVNASAYRTLSAAEKAYWGNYANVFYRPKNGTNSGQYSGYQAFQAIASTVANEMANTVPADILINGTAPPGGVTSLPFVFVVGNPPGEPIVGLLKGVSTVDFPVALSAVSEVTWLGQFKIVLDIMGGLGAPLAGLVDPNGLAWGYAVYMSNANPSPGMSFSNPEQYCLGYVPPTNVDDPADLTLTQYITVRKTTPLNLANYQAFPVIGNWVYISVYAIDQTGGTIRLGGIETSVVPTLTP